MAAQAQQSVNALEPGTPADWIILSLFGMIPVGFFVLWRLSCPLLRLRKFYRVQKDYSPLSLHSRTILLHFASVILKKITNKMKMSSSISNFSALDAIPIPSLGLIVDHHKHNSSSCHSSIVRAFIHARGARRTSPELLGVLSPADPT
jgi:hypothetical protein